IFSKGFAIVASETPELRRAYITLPWPHLYEYPRHCARALDTERSRFAPVAFPQAGCSSAWAAQRDDTARRLRPDRSIEIPPPAGCDRAASAVRSAPDLGCVLEHSPATPGNWNVRGLFRRALAD